MLETIAPIIGSLGFVALVVGLALFIPVAALKTKRPLAKKLSIGGSLFFIFALALTPASNETVASPSAIAHSASTPAPAGDGGKRELVALYRQVLAKAKPCDEAVSNLSPAAEKAKFDGNIVQLMSATAAGQNACGAAATAFRSMRPPTTLPDRAKEFTDKALRSCLRGYDRREQAFTTSTNVLAGEHGDMKEAAKDMERSRGEVIGCVTNFVAASSEAGINPKEMM